MNKLYAEIFALVQCRNQIYSGKMPRGSIINLAENKTPAAGIKTAEQEKGSYEF
jgi:hypothetical protein